MEIKASDVKALRDKTGAGMMECKKALQHCNGDAAEAEKYLKEKGLAAVEKRADRATGEGIILIKGSEKNAVMLEMSCETDFVAKNADFIAVAENIAKTALEKHLTAITDELNSQILDLATKVRENMKLERLINVEAEANEYISHYVHSDKKTGVLVILKSDKPEIFGKKEDVDSAYIKEQEEIFRRQTAELDKPEKVKEGIVKGKISKHLGEICFLEQPFVKDDKVSVAKKIEETGKAAGGSLSLSKLIIFQLGIHG